MAKNGYHYVIYLINVETKTRAYPDLHTELTDTEIASSPLGQIVTTQESRVRVWYAARIAGVMPSIYALASLWPSTVNGKGGHKRSNLVSVITNIYTKMAYRTACGLEHTHPVPLYIDIYKKRSKAVEGEKIPIKLIKNRKIVDDAHKQVEQGYYYLADYPACPSANIRINAGSVPSPHVPSDDEMDINAGSVPSPHVPSDDEMDIYSGDEMEEDLDVPPKVRPTRSLLRPLLILFVSARSPRGGVQRVCKA
jgi:hypothetical protein